MRCSALSRTPESLREPLIVAGVANLFSGIFCERLSEGQAFISALLAEFPMAAPRPATTIAIASGLEGAKGNVDGGTQGAWTER